MDGFAITHVLMVNVPQYGEKDDAATISIHKRDMKVIPVMYEKRNEEIREQFGE